MPEVPAADPATVEVAVAIARDAGALTLEWFRDPGLAVDHKADGSPVTQADVAAEALIRSRLTEQFPDDAVEGEEHDDTGGTSGRTWVVDPIDGTKAFTKGVPLYSNLVALVDEHGPAVGVINIPAMGETVWAGRGLGAFVNGTACRVSDHGSVRGAYVCTSGTDYWPRDALTRVLDSDAVLHTWGDAYGYAMVATGRAEAMIDPVAYPWDLAPVGVIVSEAGGRFTGVDGGEGPAAWRGGSGIATNGWVHDQLLALLRTP